MPRKTPRFDKGLLLQAQSASGIASAGEIMHDPEGQLGRSEWTNVRLEALYELAYLRVFAAWETCLEDVVYRSLCGYASRSGQERLVSGAYFASLTDAETAVLAGQNYVLWHDPTKVINRCRKFIAPGKPCIQEMTIVSRLTRLSELANVHHRIVHNQDDARRKFDAATLAIAGRTHPAARPGKLLRDWDTSKSPKRRWLDVLMDELVTLVSQMV